MIKQMFGIPVDKMARGQDVIDALDKLMGKPSTQVA
jgi:hypothetical protein